jgi:8-oxo-dGTP pyrophosphatase MutT (NUDIX family)
MIYNEQPKDFIPDIEVVSCLIEFKNKILLLHRNDNKIEGNKWGPPGGKVDKSDLDIKKAVIREIKEETGLSLDENNINFHKTFYLEHQEFNYLYHYFHYNISEISDIILSENEHKAYTWETPEDALEMSLVTDEDYCLKDYYGIK